MTHIAPYHDSLPTCFTLVSISSSERLSERKDTLLE